MEVNQCLIEGLVDTGASMSVMAAAVVRELGLMHLVIGLEAYKTASGAITQALGRIEEVPIKVGGVQCKMTFMVVDTDSYDALLGLDLLIKIGAIVDVKQGLIQVRRGPGADVEVLPLTMVNLLQRSGSAIDDHHDDCAQRQVPGISEVRRRASYLSRQDTDEQLAELESESDFGSSEESDEENQAGGTVEGESEFGNTELEDLMAKEGPQQILQLMLQDKADNLLKEEITDDEDYADWIQWAAEEEQRMQNLSEAAIAAEEFVLLQLQQMEVVDSSGCVKERIMKNPKEDTRWGEICQKIRIDQHLDKGMERQLWCVLEQYQDVFAWNKGELGCCNVGEHQIDTQGFPPCKVAPGRLSYWEKVEVNRQINVLVELGKMRPSNSAYACCVTLPIKKDGSRRFCGDYRPLNLQTRRDSFPMPLVEDIICQLGKSAWFTALDLQSGFWQIRMASEDMGKTALVTKSGLFEWTVMPFGLKNATSTFTVATLALGSRLMQKGVARVPA
jgi:predicted aspartyl protease